MGLEVWEDPHNGDRRYARVRVRQDALPALERALGPHVVDALASTADLARDDADALDDLAAATQAQARSATGSLAVDVLAASPAAVRRRVLRRAAVAAGAAAGDLSAAHVEAMDRLVTHWHGQSTIDLPGHLRTWREHGHVHFAAAPPAEGSPASREGSRPSETTEPETPGRVS
jgi:tRNA(Ile)-lysidine synthase